MRPAVQRIPALEEVVSDRHPAPESSGDKGATPPEVGAVTTGRPQHDSVDLMLRPAIAQAASGGIRPSPTGPIQDAPGAVILAVEPRAMHDPRQRAVEG